jgi:hypothetical protein
MGVPAEVKFNLGRPVKWARWLRAERSRSECDDVAPSRRRPYIRVVQHLDLSDEEAAALARELHDIVESDRDPFSPGIRTLRGILVKLRPEPVRQPLPPPM